MVLEPSKAAVVDPRLGTDVEALRESIRAHVRYTIGKSERAATARDWYEALCRSVRDHLVHRWITTQNEYYQRDAKRVYYLSLEFLIGRALRNAIVNLGLIDEYGKALEGLNASLDELEELEQDAGLGNGGLGRLAACFLDSMATLGVPGTGYGIRYDYGIFRQHVENGWQVEFPDDWLRLPYPWEIARPEHIFVVRFGGRVEAVGGAEPLRCRIVDAQEVLATAFDTPIPGYGKSNVNTLRLWHASGTDEFDLTDFNEGDYVGAVEHMVWSRTISRVLYPNDNTYLGRELRLKQQYFMVSASIQDAIRRHLVDHPNLDDLADRAVFQLNDTHPALAIPELMRLLVDVHDYPWKKAWSITTRCMAYTNHTLLPEALETWSVDLVQRLLPRHLMIIERINQEFLDEVRRRFPGNDELIRKVSIFQEGSPKRVRMANLATIGSFSVNGVAALHTELLQKKVLAEFHSIWPEKFNNKTNGVTPRRWLLSSNPPLARLMTETVGPDWPIRLEKLAEIEAYADDPEFQRRFKKAKLEAKKRLSDALLWTHGVRVDPDTVFDVQVKRIHEYKRQLLNVLHIIHLYRELERNPNALRNPRTFLFAGKAAPGYQMAKLIIKLINNVAVKVNEHPEVSKMLRVFFVPDYSVTKAERLIPAADVSEQISTAGFEASGTGNMKFMANGGLTIGTLDGANVEIAQEVGPENIFIFGLDVPGVERLREAGYAPRAIYERDTRIREVIDLIQYDHFSSEEPGLFRPIVDTLLGSDFYLHLADFDAYREAQLALDRAYSDPKRWWRMSVHNVARSGFFSSDRTILEYERDIWKAGLTRLEDL